MSVLQQCKLMKAAKWAAREFESDSIPDNRTIKRWVENGYLKGRVIDGSVWVYSAERWGIDSEINNTVRKFIIES